MVKDKMTQKLSDKSEYREILSFLKLRKKKKLAGLHPDLKRHPLVQLWYWLSVYCIYETFSLCMIL